MNPKCLPSLCDDHTIPKAWVESAYIHILSRQFPPHHPLRMPRHLCNSWQKVPSMTRHDLYCRDVSFLLVTSVCFQNKIHIAYENLKHVSGKRACDKKDSMSFDPDTECSTLKCLRVP
ncbi:hypothetical protein TNCV_4244341 [Trichonephila clavipes]|nr:hypothetical protein TNCV_4244341 [Trichonephila clavipes]